LLSVALPPFILLAAVGISRLRPLWLRDAALAGVVGLALHGAYSYYYHQPKADWRGATAYILANSRAADAAVFYVAIGQRPFEYYRDRSGARASSPQVVFPTQQEYWLPRPRPSDALIESLPVQHDRVWVVLGHLRGERSEIARSMHTSMTRHYKTATERAFAGVSVILYSVPRKD
jgi:hypothetical protein